MQSRLDVRLLSSTDQLFLLRVIALAIGWRPGTEVRSADAVLADLELARYARDWTVGADAGLVAEVHGKPIGAAWWRFFPAEHPGYGFTATDVPEVTIGVEHGHRRGGVGTRLLRDLIELAHERELPALSLSVEPDNPAADLYRRLGFVKVGVHGGADTMRLNLCDPG